MTIKHSAAAALDSRIEAVRDEARRAQERYGPFTSTHEALGVLTEEVAELVEAVRSNVLQSIQREAEQVAAVALRLAAQCREGAARHYATPFAERSVGKRVLP